MTRRRALWFFGLERKLVYAAILPYGLSKLLFRAWVRSYKSPCHQSGVELDTTIRCRRQNHVGVDFPAIFLLLWIGIIVFEIAAPLVAWRLQPACGIAIVFFHCATYLTMDIHYVPAAILSVVLLCLTPYKRK